MPHLYQIVKRISNTNKNLDGSIKDIGEKRFISGIIKFQNPVNKGDYLLCPKRERVVEILHIFPTQNQEGYSVLELEELNKQTGYDHEDLAKKMFKIDCEEYENWFNSLLEI